MGKVPDLEDFYHSCVAYRANLSFDPVFFEGYVTLVERYAEPNDKILDIGCGNGMAVSMLAQRGFRVIGIDLSSQLATEVRRLQSAGSNYACASAYFLPFADSSFDVVTSHDFIEHVTGVEAVLEEMIRLTGKFLIIKSPNLLSPLKPAYNVLLHCLGRLPTAYPVTSSPLEAAKLAVRSTLALLSKRLVPSRRTFIYREPDFTAQGGDLDAAFLANSVDLGHYLEATGFRIIDIRRPYPNGARLRRFFSASNLPLPGLAVTAVLLLRNVLKFVFPELVTPSVVIAERP